MSKPSRPNINAIAASCVLLAACVGNIGDGADGEDGSKEPTTSPTGWYAPEMKRLTAPQYINSIHDVFGSDVVVGAALEQDETNELFLSMGAAKVGTSDRGVEQYHAAAIDIASQVVANAANYDVLSSCAPYDPSNACVHDALEYFGTSLWRRAMTTEELSRVVAVQSASPQQDAVSWELGMSYAIAALLSSPHFIYLPELGEQETESGAYRYTGYEMASRLSYVLWNSTPDQELLRAAADGELVTRDGVRAQADRMLDMPRAEDLATRFFGESWMVAGLDHTDKNTNLFTEWTPELVAAYHQEFDLFLRDLTVDRDGDIRELFTAESTFVNELLAGVYDMNASGSDYQSAPMPAGRTGLLTSGAVMAAVSPSDRTSPTHRGVFVLERLLCTEVPAPPASVNDVLESPSVDENATLRDKLEQHREDPACASCHALFDPLGFTFENFDSIGRYREMDGNLPVDSTGELDGLLFEGATDLASFLVEDPRMTACIADRLYSFAVGHEPRAGEEGVVDELTTALRGHYRFRQLMVDIVSSEGFRYLEPTEEEGN
jgi:hypothetical protein